MVHHSGSVAPRALNVPTRVRLVAPDGYLLDTMVATKVALDDVRGRFIQPIVHAGICLLVRFRRDPRYSHLALPTQRNVNLLRIVILASRDALVGFRQGFGTGGPSVERSEPLPGQRERHRQRRDQASNA
eukprot:279073-Pyramimonas_sp.AAC.2